MTIKFLFNSRGYKTIQSIYGLKHVYFKLKGLQKTENVKLF